MTTLEKLHGIAETTRKDISDVHGQCYPASKKLREKLASETMAKKSDIEIEEVRMGEHGTLRHYVVAFPANHIEDCSALGRVLIDITLDQYCAEYEEQGLVETSIGTKDDIPNVCIFQTKQQSPYG